jgi:GNAT superfamily N-acetyltransferase
MLTIEPASRLSLDELSALVTRCYEGYYVSISLDAAMYARMVRAWDLDLDRSRVLMVDGTRVAVAILGVRGDRGWIGGMGVVPEARGSGHGRAAMESVLAEARAAGLTQVDLEVLVHNTPAARIYEAMGFRDTRTLNVWAREAGLAPPPAPALRVDVVPLDEALAAHARLHAARSPWQRDLRSLERLMGPLRALAVSHAGAIAACAIYRADPGKLQIFDIGAAKGAPPDSIGAVLSAVLRVEPASAANLVNLVSNDPAADALQALGFRVVHRQREMAITVHQRTRAPLAGRFLDAEGRLFRWPTKRGDQLEVLGLMAAQFTPGQFYSEREVNELLNQWHTFGDWALLRRALFDFGFMDRTSDGARYWRKEDSQPSGTDRPRTTRPAE